MHHSMPVRSTTAGVPEAAAGAADPEAVWEEDWGTCSVAPSVAAEAGAGTRRAATSVT